ncbi:MarR family winged helix-turn-helix transcriptional regulator [Nocardia sp. GTS18]|uniref:MarR family winged helix-turn-helix transcriptional regulator n=1 Tax=Nocardia sp. GTS18 TaxID=1778064 RepID=UPI0015EF6085|nr:MarR family transcriptional regulator [Nocardia sp. GTS18]
MPADELNLGVLLFIPYREMERRVLDALSEGGFDDLTPAQARLVARIGPDGSRLTDLAAEAQVTKQTAGVLVDQLVRAGYLRREPDPSDGRARLLRPSDKGARAVEVANQAARQVESEWLAHLGPRRSTALRGALEELRKITDPYR